MNISSDAEDGPLEMEEETYDPAYYRDMARCFVPSCGKFRRDFPDSIFLQIPKSLKETWCRAVARNCPKRYLLICNEHVNFQEDCFQTKAGRWRLKETANLILSGTTDDPCTNSCLDAPSSWLHTGLFCRICLVQDAKLYDIETYNLRGAYEVITNTLLPKDGLPQKLCWECRARLQSCVRFRDKAILSQSILSEIEPSNRRNIKILANIDRDKYNLKSSLVTKTVTESEWLLTEVKTEASESPIQVKEESDSEMNHTQTDTGFMEHEVNVKLEPDPLEMADPFFDETQDCQEAKEGNEKGPLLNENVLNVDFNAHVETNTSNKFICHECGVGFEVGSDLERHIYTHEPTDIGTHKEPKKIYTCKTCSITFETKFVFMEHMRSEHKLKHFLCKFCQFTSVNMNSLLIHQRTHGSEKIHKCIHCDFKTVIFTQLEIHFKSSHAGMNILKCNSCSFTCNRKALLLRHEKKHSEKPYKCDLCVYQSTKAFDLKKHLTEVHDVKAFSMLSL